MYKISVLMESGLNKVSISLHCNVRTWESIQTLTCVGIHTMKICYVQIINSWDRAMDYPLPAKSIDIGDPDISNECRNHTRFACELTPIF